MAKRVYFAFHYQDVIDFRANTVRKHNFIEGVKAAGYYDHSIWEDAKLTSPISLKRLINKELENTSVTAVLIGSSTWSRRWVRYEIFKSMERGNTLIGIHINSIKGKDELTKALGPNPFDNLGIHVDASGLSGRPTEWKDGKWVYYDDLAAFDLTQCPIHFRGLHVTLARWYPIYDWVADNGYRNFNSWIAS